MAFGSLDGSEEPLDWRDQEALANEAALKSAQKGPGFWASLGKVLPTAGRMVNALASAPVQQAVPLDEATQQYFPETTVNPLVHNLLGAAGEAVKSGVTASGDVASGKVPVYDAEGHISPELVGRAFDMASIAGGGSAAGNIARETPAMRLGRDMKIFGKEVGSGEPFPHQLVDQPAGASAPPIQPYRPRGAIDARADAELGWHANDAGLTPVSTTLPHPWETGSAVMSDTAKPGAAVAAAEHAPPFYSPTEAALGKVTAKALPGSGWINQLQRYGAKPEEMDWTGLTDYLRQRAGAKVSREEVEKHIADNRFAITSLERKSIPPWEELTQKQKNQIDNERSDYLYDIENNDGRREAARWSDRWPDAEAFYRYRQENGWSDHPFRPGSEMTKYDDYQLPGGKNYRERLLTLPQKPVASLDPTDRLSGTTALQRQAARDSGNYLGPHWSEPNVLVHRRSTDRFIGGDPMYGGTVEAESRAIDNIENKLVDHYGDPSMASMASGTAAKAVRDGVLTPEEAGYYARFRGWHAPEFWDHETRQLTQPSGMRSLHAEEIQSDWHQQGREKGYGTKTSTTRYQMFNDKGGSEGVYDTIAEAEAAKRRLHGVTYPGATVPNDTTAWRINPVEVVSERGVPDAPFKESWPTLAAHDHLREAAEGGYPRISWTAGEHSPTNPKVLWGDEPIPESHRAEAEKADKGLRDFYNRRMVDTYNKIGKEHGVQVKESSIPRAEASGGRAMTDLGIPQEKQLEYWEGLTSEQRDKLREDYRDKGHRVFYMDVPESLRQQYLRRGASLFEDTGPAAGAVSTASHAGGRNVETTGPGGLARSDVAGGAGGGAGSLEQAAAAAARRAGATKPLPGLPTKAMKIGDEHFVPGPIGSIHDMAKSYMASRDPAQHSMPFPDRYIEADPERGAAIARAYDEMKHEPENPRTKLSYQAMARETRDQFDHLMKSGLKVEPIPPGMPDPYALNPRLAAKDVADNNHLWYFPSEGGFGTGEQADLNFATHPMLQSSGRKINGKEVPFNDLFRIVHDYFGHLKEGYGFRAGGEDNAWRSHAAMYSDLARPAMTTETRGQNSWVNFGPHGAANRKASAADTVYADQKIGLLPEWTMTEGYPGKVLREGGAAEQLYKAIAKRPGESPERPRLSDSARAGLPIAVRNHQQADFGSLDGGR